MRRPVAKTNQMVVRTSRIIFTQVVDAVIDVLVTSHTSKSRATQTVKPIQHCNRYKEERWIKVEVESL